MLSFIPVIALIVNLINVIFIGKTAHFITLISLGTIFSAWSAGKSFGALTEAFNNILNVKKSKNYILKRLRGSLVSVIFALLVVCLIVVGLFGSKIATVIFQIKTSHKLFMFLRMIFFGICIWLIICFAYIFLPDYKNSHYYKTMHKKPYGKILLFAALSGLLICLLMLIFSIYVSSKTNITNFNTFFSFVASMLLWIYISFYSIIVCFAFIFRNVSGQF